MKLCDTCIYGDKYEFEKPCVLYSDDCKLYEEKKMDDMTRKRAISELNQIYGMLSPDKQRALDVAINSLKIDEQYDLMYEQAEPTGWIPVSERLPKLREDEDDTFISDNVLVWLSHEFDAENPMICYYFKYDEWEGFVPTALSKDWEYIHSGSVYPVAWMPLPEPYKAESEEV